MALALQPLDWARARCSRRSSGPGPYSAPSHFTAPRRAIFVLSKIDEILAWEKRVEAHRDNKFVELGRYLCEVRAGQCWRVENLKSFDEFLERRFPRRGRS